MKEKKICIWNTIWTLYVFYIHTSKHRNVVGPKFNLRSKLNFKSVCGSRLLVTPFWLRPCQTGAKKCHPSISSSSIRGLESLSCTLISANPFASLGVGKMVLRCLGSFHSQKVDLWKRRWMTVAGVPWDGDEAPRKAIVGEKIGDFIQF